MYKSVCTHALSMLVRMLPSCVPCELCEKVATVQVGIIRGTMCCKIDVLYSNARDTMNRLYNPLHI